MPTYIARCQESQKPIENLIWPTTLGEIAEMQGKHLNALGIFFNKPALCNGTVKDRRNAFRLFLGAAI